MKKKTYDVEEVLKLIDSYMIETGAEKITIPEFGHYLRAKGYKIQDHTIRREKKWREYMDRINEKDEEKRIKTVAAYQTIDAAAFIRLNNTPEKMIEALNRLDRYYYEVSTSAAYIFQENKTLKKEKQAHFRSEQKAENKEKDARIRELEKKIDKLRAVIDTYVYPEIANEILYREGLLEKKKNIILPDLGLADVSTKIDFKPDTGDSEDSSVSDSVNTGTLVNELLEALDE